MAPTSSTVSQAQPPLDHEPDFHCERIDVNDDKEWDELFKTYWDAWKDPPQVTGLLTFPWLGEGGPREAAAYEAAKRGYQAEARANPNQHWIKIEDRALPGPHRIVGGGAYTTFPDGAFPDYAKTVAAPAQDEEDRLPDISLPGLGYPAGSERDSLMRQLYAQITFPFHGHALWIMPAYRHLGAGAALLDFWLADVDRLGLESYLEGSVVATSLYLEKGFVLLERPVMVFRYFPKNKSDAPSAEWPHLVRRLHAEPIAIMWRPAGGVYEEGKTVLPWVGKPRRAKL
ncbi:5484286f-38bf-46be-85b9-cb144f630e3b [Thermothielavioides terrestris]|uniref:5484286f-38bf-46be-85b9-cb144f630e3b n=1 Tax=Thermothielavioides terrestris TaxID=2587410 RepID=A0A446BFB2_9PEZI|nr:5484286f-38bf-46be-85b9-cb144f630e3b [Thermothielavioides terrestris]